MSEISQQLQVGDVVKIAPNRQRAEVVKVSSDGRVTVRRPGGHETPFLPGVVTVSNRVDGPECSCAHNADGSTTTMLCSSHADTDPCLTMASVTGKRRKGTIRRGTCTSCGWSR